jgi:indolepyruvate decarboxylase
MFESRETTVAGFLVDRLAQAGIGHCFGVPGDFNLVLLDAIVAHPEVEWVGNANELNAAYAADGYARCRGAAALVTTFGVGELSAINGLAGSYAEYVPVLQVVGAPSRSAKRARAILHHTLGDGDFDHFSRIHAEVTVARAWLTPENAADEIDRVIGEMLFERRPGYVVLPSDVVNTPVETAPPLVAREPWVDLKQLADFTAHANRLLRDAKRPAVLADFLVDRFGARDALRAILCGSGFAYATMLLGKALLDESSGNFVGTYVGAASEPAVRDVVEGADVLIAAGILLTDVLTAGFTQRLQTERMIELHPFHAKIAGREYTGVPMLEAFRALGSVLDVSRPSREIRTTLPRAAAELSTTTRLTQAAFWEAAQQFLRPGDIVVAEQGTAFFGLGPKRCPADTLFLGQPLWGSIGYALPAAFGAGTALPGRRLVVFVGDGSAMMTVQEIGSMLRDGLNPIIFLLNNEGYTVERAIHGPEQPYNDIPRWDWTAVPQAMGPGRNHRGMRVETAGELQLALREVDQADTLVMLEVVLPRHDVPELLAKITNGVASINGSEA